MEEGTDWKLRKANLRGGCMMMENGVCLILKTLMKIDNDRLHLVRNDAPGLYVSLEHSLVACVGKIVCFMLVRL